MAVMKLKRCPFCGGMPIYTSYSYACGLKEIRTDEHGIYWGVSCRRCKATTLPMLGYAKKRKKDEAAVHWNTRLS